MGNNKLDKVSSTLAVEYKDFFQEILTKIQSARYEMLLSVSKQTLLLYWDIGKAVSKKMASGGWGQSVVEQLSKDLQTECPGVRGFSTRNIWRMKTFYEFYAGFLISAPVGAEITEQLNSATAVAELPETTETKISATAVAELPETKISAPTGAELERLPPMLAEIGWVQNCLIIEKCKNLKQIEFYLRMTKAKGWSKLDLLEKINTNYFENHSLAQNNFDSVVPEALKAQVAWEFLDDYNVELINPDQPFSEKALENAIVENIGVIVCRDKNRLEVEYMLELAKDPMGVATFNKYRDLPVEYAKYLPSEIEISKRLSSFVD